MANAQMTSIGLDALPPPQMAGKAEQVGLTKSGLDAATTFALAVLAGAFIALGAAFATTTTTGGGAMPYGVARLLGGLTFSLGLILVIVAGAELFTGNNLIVMAWASRRVTTLRVARNWTIVYVGNFVGAKTNLGFVQAVALGALCNALVCLAVWLCYSARTTADKVLSIIPPIAAFVAVGFEHSVANMYFIPYALFVKGNESFVASLPRPAPDLSHLTWGAFFADNLLPVTIGNVIGGAVMVGAVYWFVYLRERAPITKSGG